MAAVDRWTYRTVAGDEVTVIRSRGKGTKPRRDPVGVEGPYLPYQFDELENGCPVVISEGERCRDVLHEWGFASTCWIGGAQSVGQTDWTALQGRDCILWPDRDETGVVAMEWLDAKLQSLGCAVKVVKLPDGPDDSWDAADCSFELAVRLISEAAPTRVTYLDVAGELPDEAQCYPAWQPIPGLLECGSVAIWHGPPKGGKSAFALLAAAQLLSGRCMVGIDNEAAPNPAENRTHRLLMVWLEDQKSTTDMRRWAICRRFKLPVSTWAESRWVYNLYDGPDSDVMGDMGQVADRMAPTVILVDNLARMDPQAETDSARATMLIRGLEDIAQTHNAAVVLLHHDRKSNGDHRAQGDELSRGTSAIAGAARVMVGIKGSDGNVEVKGGGTNNARPAPPVRFQKSVEVVNGFQTVVLVHSMPTDPFDGLSVDEVISIHRELCEAPAFCRQYDNRAIGWAGHHLATAMSVMTGQGKTRKDCNRDELDARKRMETILAAWAKSGVLTVGVEPVETQSRKTVDRKCWQVGPNPFKAEEKP